MNDFRRSVASLAVFVCASVFLSSVLFERLHHAYALPHWGAALLDTLVVSLLVFPGLHFFLLRPLARQVQERQQAESSLREREAHYRAVTHAAGDAIITADHAGNIADWNPAAERMFGYAESEVLGRPLTLLMPPRFREPHENGLKRVTKDGERHIIGKTVELSALRRDAGEFAIELSLAEWATLQGRYFTAIIRDITQRKSDEAAREKLIVELREALAQIHTLNGLLPICAWCNKVRDDKGYWSQLEQYLGQHTRARLTHGVCPDCAHHLLDGSGGGGPSRK